MLKGEKTPVPHTGESEKGIKDTKEGLTSGRKDMTLMDLGEDGEVFITPGFHLETMVVNSIEILLFQR